MKKIMELSQGDLQNILCDIHTRIHSNSLSLSGLATFIEAIQFDTTEIFRAIGNPSESLSQSNFQSDYEKLLNRVKVLETRFSALSNIPQEVVETQHVDQKQPNHETKKEQTQNEVEDESIESLQYQVINTQNEINQKIYENSQLEQRLGTFTLSSQETNQSNPKQIEHSTLPQITQNNISASIQDAVNEATASKHKQESTISELQEILERKTARISELKAIANDLNIRRNSLHDEFQATSFVAAGKTPSGGKLDSNVPKQHKTDDVQSDEPHLDQLDTEFQIKIGEQSNETQENEIPQEMQ